MQQADLIKRIKELKLKRNAVILSHYYSRPEVQDIADFVGDSLALSQEAVRQDAEVIVFCGVHFMGESAAILSPNKTVLLPEIDATCPMADMVNVEGLKKLKEEHPEALVVSYVNSSAAVKAESYICCTSANAVEVVNSLDADEVIFVPDKNLAAYVAARTDKKIIPWEGHCPTHHQILREDVLRMKEKHPQAKFIAHPECRPEVLELADHVASTRGMIVYAKKSPAHEFIIGTECGLIHGLLKAAPEKKYYCISEFACCPSMKMISLEKVLVSLEKMQHVVIVPEDVRIKAKEALDRMLTVKVK
ncbi:Quinolinate synthetase [Methanosarcina horonobensis HB-1 = JCM 15518]|uniref:Quinolinate synthase n=1 Tax=Methanosarcina horonobensis HB-1 = JCM 15518 TaxID=1434110 RepID=A0A0E3SCP5_9EURY|nr:quinolinate synthase NadA [Methanosarcina horonobensis]AKB79759.1 Quinolinate synthetase [Methanosarcina horonobensis HB-1 = JCM 15518]